MSGCASGARARTVLFLTTPALWPTWPFLPVVRCTGARTELGVMFDAKAAGLTGFRATVFITNLFLLPPTFEEFLALPHETFRNAGEVADAGWSVD